jgi:hypothetical protein
MVVDEEVLGPEAATTLIEHLPPVGWADVVTKHDLAGLEQRVDVRFTVLEERIDDRFALSEERNKAATSDLRAMLEHELRSQSTTIIFGLVGIMLTMAALVRLT